MAKTKLKLNLHPRDPQTVWFWLKAQDDPGPWHLRRYEMSPRDSGVCGWKHSGGFYHAARKDDGDCQYLYRNPPFDWEQYYLDHRDTEEFCTECIAHSPWAFRLACLEAQQDEK